MQPFDAKMFVDALISEEVYEEKESEEGGDAEEDGEA